MVFNIDPDTLIIQLIEQGYLALFLITIIEGPLITILGGFLISMGVFKLIYAYPILLIADTIGDLIAYTIGYIGRKRFAVKILGWFKMSEDKLLGLDNFFKRHGGKSIFLAKFITGAGSWTLVSAGMAKVKLRRFLKYSITAGALKTIVYMGIGYVFGDMYKILIKWMDVGSAVIIILILLILLIISVKSYFKKRFKSFSKIYKKSKKK